MLLLTLTVHELGHLAMARLNRARVTGFQIGVGWPLARVHTGRTVVRLGPQPQTLGAGKPESGDIAAIFVDRDPGETEYRAVCTMTGSRKELPAGQRNIPDRFRETHMQLTGRVRETDGERIVLAGMSWSLHAFPVAAGVIISDDPARRLPEAYNVMPWPKKASITLAGPASNVILTAAVLVIIAVFPVTRVSAPVLTVQYVEPGGPAAQAGMLPGDRIIEVNNRLNPGAEEMREMTAAAALRGGILRVRALRQGEGSVYLRVRPRPETGRIGVLLTAREIQGGNTG